MRALLIEGDTAMAKTVDLMLQGEGFEVSETDLGEEGLDWCGGLCRAPGRDRHRRVHGD